MKVLLLAKKPPFPPNDGEAIAILQMAKGLADAGNEVDVLYMNTRKHAFEEQQIPSEIKNKIAFFSAAVNADAGIAGALKNLFTSKPYHVRRFFKASFENKLRELLKKKSYDVVQCEGLFLTEYADCVKRNSNARIIYRSHNVEGMIWSRYAAGIRDPFKKIFIRLQAKKLLAYEQQKIKDVDAVVSISNSDADWYGKYIPATRIKFSPTGISGETEMPSKEIDRKSIYFLGGLDWLPNREGLNWFIEKVFPLVLRTRGDIRLHIAGRNAPAGFSSRFSDTSVVYYGEVENSLQFIADKFISIVPLLSGSGMKIKIIEALAASKPVVTTHIGAEGMPAGVEQYLNVAHTPDEFADAILRIFASPEEFIKRAAEATEFILKKLDNSTLGIELTDFYKTLQA